MKSFSKMDDVSETSVIPLIRSLLGINCALINRLVLLPLNGRNTEVVDRINGDVVRRGSAKVS